MYSQSSYDLHLSSLTRDGGQRLDADDSLYDDTRRTSYVEIVQHFDDLVEPIGFADGELPGGRIVVAGCSTTGSSTTESSDASSFIELQRTCGTAEAGM